MLFYPFMKGNPVEKILILAFLYNHDTIVFYYSHVSESCRRSIKIVYESENEHKVRDEAYFLPTRISSVPNIFLHKWKNLNRSSGSYKKRISINLCIINNSSSSMFYCTGVNYFVRSGGRFGDDDNTCIRGNLFSEP